MILPATTNPTVYPDPVQTIAVAGGKGGVGKSIVAVNLAAAMGTSNHEVLLVDGDLELGNVDRLLNLRPKFGLQEVFTGARRLDLSLIHI